MNDETRVEIDGIIDRVIKQAQEERKPISHVANNGALHGASPLVVLHLAKAGLTYKANITWHRRMGGGGRVEESHEIGFVRGPSGANPGHPHPRDEDVLMRVWFAVPGEGEQLPAMQVTVQGWRKIEEEFRAKAIGWAQKADLAYASAEHLEIAGVDRLAELPPAKLAIIRKAFERVWGAS